MRPHYAWVVVAVTFLALLVAASVRAAPGILILPLEREFGWDRATVSGAIAISILTFGLGGPLSGTLVGRYGPRKVILGGSAVIALGLGAFLTVHELWQLFLFWGVVVGVGTGAVGNVLGATVAHRWFRTHRGLVIGLFGAATSAGSLVFIPAMAALSVSVGWRGAIVLLIVACLAVLVPVALFMRDRPADAGTRAFGEGQTISTAERDDDQRRTPLRAAVRTMDFWLLAGSFFICGYTSNGLIGTHLIPHAVEHGFTEVTAASAVGVMGAMNIVGTLSSGWLSDRFDNRKLTIASFWPATTPSGRSHSRRCRSSSKPAGCISSRSSTDWTGSPPSRRRPISPRRSSAAPRSERSTAGSSSATWRARRSRPFSVGSCTRCWATTTSCSSPRHCSASSPPASPSGSLPAPPGGRCW